jgi:hypothetical protein
MGIRYWDPASDRRKDMAFPTQSRPVVGKPHIYRKQHGRWAFNPTVWSGLTPKQAGKLNYAASKWIDRRNYFLGIKAGIQLGRALDCTARGCPVPQEEVSGNGPYN